MEEKMMCITEVAEELNVKPSAVRKWVLEKRIDYVKIGSLVRFKPETIRQIKEGGLR